MCTASAWSCNELLTGRRSFRARRGKNTTNRSAPGAPAPALDRRFHPPCARRICLKCLSKAVADRYMTGAKLATELRRVAAKTSESTATFQTGVRTDSKRRRRARGSRRIGVDHPAEPRADDEALVRGSLGIAEQARHGSLPRSLMREREHSNRAGHAGRAPADHRRVERQRLPVASRNMRRRGLRRRDLAAVVDGDLAASPHR